MPPTWERLLNGEEITELVLDEATRDSADLVRKINDPAFTNSFLMQAALQGITDTMDPVLAGALRTGLGMSWVRHNYVFAQTKETPEERRRNDRFAEMGRQIIASGAKYRGRTLHEIESGSTFMFTHVVSDPLTHAPQIRKDTHIINEEWRRGFQIAVAICEGQTEITDLQKEVRRPLWGDVMNGFDVGQYIQLKRTDSENYPGPHQIPKTEPIPMPEEPLPRPAKIPPTEPVPLPQGTMPQEPAGIPLTEPVPVPGRRWYPVDQGSVLVGRGRGGSAQSDWQKTKYYPQ